MAAAKPKSALRSVDPHSGSSYLATIYEDGDGVVWNSMLNFTDISYGTFGNNKYYSIQLICDGGRFKVFRKWGRVGATNPQSTTELFSSVEPAKSAFQKAFASKSGNAWPLTNGAFAKKKGKYVFVELADDEPDESASMSAGGLGSNSGAANGGGGNNNNNNSNKNKISTSTAQSKLPEPVQDVIKLICDSSLIAKEVSSMNVDLKRMPLGRLSKAQISQGYALLQQLSDALTEIEAIESPASAAARATAGLGSSTSTAVASSPTSVAVPASVPAPAPSTVRASRRRATASTATPTSVAAGPATAPSSSVPTTPAPVVRRSARGRAASAGQAAVATAATTATPTTAAAPTAASAGSRTRKKKLSAADTNRVRELKAELKTLTSEFYSLIPHDFGRALPPVLDSLEVVKTKIDLLQVLADIEISQQLQQEEKKRVAAGGAAPEPVHPLDTQYAMLKTEMEALDPASDEFQLIERFVERTQAPSQTAYRLKIKSVLKITRPDEQAPRTAFAHVDNHRLLWHGSRLSNVVGILSQGLRIAPPEAPKNGYMFGKGIYFADSVSKSAQYCWTSPDRPRAVLLLAEVALGKSYEAPRAEYLDFAAINARGCASTKGVGRMAPREETFEKTPDGVMVPSGQIVAQSAASSGAVLFNEFIVYRPEQVKLRYLITTDFDYSVSSVPRPVATSGFGSTSAFGSTASSGFGSTTAFGSGFGSSTSNTPASCGFSFGGGGGFGAAPVSSGFGGGFGTANSSSSSVFGGGFGIPPTASGSSFGQPASSFAATSSSATTTTTAASGGFVFGTSPFGSSSAAASTTQFAGFQPPTVFRANGAVTVTPTPASMLGAPTATSAQMAAVSGGPPALSFGNDLATLPSQFCWYNNAWHRYANVGGVWKLVPTSDVPPSGCLRIGTVIP